MNKRKPSLTSLVAFAMLLTVLYVLPFGPLCSMADNMEHFPDAGYAVIDFVYYPLLTPIGKREPWTRPFFWYLEYCGCKTFGW